jgi:hypothetical protein
MTEMSVENPKFITSQAEKESCWRRENSWQRDVLNLVAGFPWKIPACRIQAIRIVRHA